MRRLLWSLLLLPSLAFAQCNAGASFLGICSSRFPCGPALQVFNDIPVKRMVFLAETFGRRCGCVKRFLGLSGRKVLRVHLANCTCFPERGRRCEKGEPFAGMTLRSVESQFRRNRRGVVRRYQRSLRRTQRFLSVYEGREDIELYLSLCLESPLTGKARRNMLRAAREIFPVGRFVDSVLSQRCLGDLICEKHGAAPRVKPPCFVDTDGVSFRDINVPRFFEAGRQCIQSDLWTYRFNLIDLQRGYVPPKRRTMAPTAKDFSDLRRWFERCYF